jgi:MFS family permease
LRAVQWLNFFLADVQTGLGPFLAAYLASSGWNPSRVGYALTFGGLVSVAMQTPAGAVIDAVHRKRAILAASLGVLVAGAVLLMGHLGPIRVYAAQLLIGGSGPFLGATVAAITLGIVGACAFDRQFGKNQAFNSAGNVFTALLVGYASYKFGYRAIFVIAALFAIPAAVSLFTIDGKQIDYARARGAIQKQGQVNAEELSALFRDRILLCFLATAFLFHLANAAMLPELGEMLSKDNVKTAAPFMSACIIVTQLVITVTAVWIGRRAAAKGRKPLL